MRRTPILIHVVDNWHLILLSTVIGILVAIFLLFALPNKYEAKALLQVGQVSEQGIESSLNTVQRLKSNSFQEEVTQLIHNEYPNQNIEDIRKDLKKTFIDLIKNTDIINIKLAANSPLEAKKRIGFYVSALEKRHLILSKSIREFYEQQLIHAENKLQSLNHKNTERVKTPQIDCNIQLDSHNEAIYWNQQIFIFKQALTAPKTRPTSLLESINSLDEPVAPKKVIFILMGTLLGLIFGIVSTLITYQYKMSKN